MCHKLWQMQGVTVAALLQIAAAAWASSWTPRFFAVRALLSASAL
jgi:hypothetical protein